ncbi:MAG TPA: hypothetical protein ENK86_04015 [Campylobacterales bacterium]|nr:hypothetical protein [Campylobacterales bacterium]
MISIIKHYSILVISVLMLGCGMTQEQEISDALENESATVVEGVSYTHAKLTPTQQHVLQRHNEKRNLYFSDSNLSYSIELEEAAQAYANLLAKKGTFEHDTQNGTYDYGENLYAHAYQADIDIDDAMYHWFDVEEPLYHYNDGSCQEAYYDSGAQIKCGHYTQVLWQESREVGCASAQYQSGSFKDGYVYVCKYRKAGNRGQQKPYCLEYSNRDLFSANPPNIQSLTLANQNFKIELIEEDRVDCQREEHFNSYLRFNSNASVAIIDSFQIFNNGEYANTLEFDTIYFDGDVLKMVGWNRHINDPVYQDKMVYMSLKVIGETSQYYSVEMEWNGLDMGQPSYARTMKAKLYKS